MTHASNTGSQTGSDGTIGIQDPPIPLSIAWAVSNILTVGVGEEYSTIAAAVAAARNGDIIEVNAGTYTNDFAIVTANVTLIGVGGIVNMVATEPPTNLKGIITVDASCTIENFSFTGAAISDADGEVRGIRGSGAASSSRRDRSLGVLTQRFIKLFLLDRKVLSLDYAVPWVIPDDDEDDEEGGGGVCIGPLMDGLWTAEDVQAALLNEGGGTGDSGVEIGFCG